MLAFEMMIMLIMTMIHSFIYFAQNTIKTRKIDSVDEQDNKVLCCILSGLWPESTNGCAMLLLVTLSAFNSSNTLNCKN